MDGERFDSLVKRVFARKLTRVSLLRGVAGGAVASVAGTSLRPGRAALAQSCRSEGQNCEGGGQICCAFRPAGVGETMAWMPSW